jgi:hypothetical protein
LEGFRVACGILRTPLEPTDMSFLLTLIKELVKYWGTFDKILGIVLTILIREW